MNRQLPLADTGRVVVTLAIVVFACAAASVVAEERAFVALGLQVLAVEFAAGNLAVSWASAYRPVAGLRDVSAYLARGAALALGPVALSGLVAMGVGAKLEVERIYGWGAMVGVVEIALAAARDEILLRGLLRRGFSALLPRLGYTFLAAIAAAAWSFGLGETSLAVIAREAALALVAVELWRLDDGAVSAIGFQLGFRFLEAPFGGNGAQAPVLLAETAALALTAAVLARREEPSDLLEGRARAAGGRSGLVSPRAPGEN